MDFGHDGMQPAIRFVLLGRREHAMSDPIEPHGGRIGA